MEEVFRYVPGYEGRYEISNFGKVKSLNYLRTGKAKLLRPGITSKGYCFVVIFSGNSKKYMVHQLVAMAFMNHTPCGNELVVNHKDHNRQNNYYKNLEVVTNRKNCSHRKKAGSSKYTGVHWNKKNKKYVAHIQINGKNKHLGLFKNDKKASEAYQKALLELTS